MACIIDEKILNSFKNFILKSKIDSASLEALEDNVVSSYVINAIKQFYEEYENHKAWIDDNVEKSFDIENFIEIIDAYFEGFSELNEALVIIWLVELKRNIDNEVNTETKFTENEKIGLSECLKEFKIEETKNTPKNKKIKNNKSLVAENPDIQNLCEMFPSVSVKNVFLVYKKNNNDYNRALDELLENKDNLIDISSDDSDTEIQIKSKYDMTDEEKQFIKEKTVERYGFVKVIEKDESVNPINHPTPLWNGEKKLIRYFDNKVVTTKGDKHAMPKTEEEIEKEKEMKKTYINLKPAKAYRFH